MRISASGQFSTGAALHADTLAPSSAKYAALEDKIGANQKVIGAYDVSVANGSFEGNVTLTLPLDAAYNGKTVAVLYQNAEDIQTVSGTAANGKVAVSVSAFGPVMLTVEKETGPEQPESSSSSIGSSDPDSSDSDSNNSSEPVSNMDSSQSTDSSAGTSSVNSIDDTSDTNTANPKTGDVPSVALTILLGIAATAGLTCRSKFKKSASQTNYK